MPVDLPRPPDGTVDVGPGDAPAAPAESQPVARERFFSRAMLAGLSLYGLFALTFSYFQVSGDGVLYFNVLRRFFGEYLPEGAYAYQFGSALWNAPFFLVGKGLGAIFGYQPRTFHVSFEEISLTVAANAALVLTLYLGWKLLKELGLPRGPGVLLLTVFGSPLFYYVIFDPAGKHAVDTLVLTAAVYSLLRMESRPSWRLALGAGALAALSVNIRWINVVFFAALVIALLVRGRFRQVGIAAGAAVVLAPLILALPAFRGIPYYSPGPDFPPWGEQHVGFSAERLASSAEYAKGGIPAVDFNPAVPAYMLFGQHRGLFAWTPATALAILGFLVALVSAHRRKSPWRAFMWTLGLASLALLLSHSWWTQWDGGFAFSQRFLTALFPLYLIGTAELIRRARFVAYPLLVAGAAYAVFVAFVHDIGYDGISQADGVERHLRAGYEGRRALRLDVQDDAKARYAYLWGLLEGRDTECIHDPPGTPGC